MTGPGDLRPISVTSILSRTVEQVVVKNYLTQLLDSTSFYDQYAYKPTGSTTCVSKLLARACLNSGLRWIIF